MTVPQPPAEYRRVVRRKRKPITFGPAMLVAVLGAVGIVVSLFLPWRQGDILPSDIPIQFLWDTTPGSEEPSLLLLLLPILLVLVLGAVVPGGGPARIGGAFAVLVIAGVFAYQVDRAIDVFPGASLGDALDVGFYFAVVSALLVLGSGLLPGDWHGGSTDVVEDVVVQDEVIDRRLR
jgi:hypothetical protein